ncbi:MAG: hypothetical protein ACHBN1_16045 [Heteroscytonema crispum UTEX LB 1556]
MKYEVLTLTIGVSSFIQNPSSFLKGNPNNNWYYSLNLGVPSIADGVS